MIIVHHLNNSRSQRILWLLEELNVEYEIKRYERDPVTIRAPQSLKEIHPLGKSPVIQDGDIVVAESGAIIEYLVRQYGSEQFMPEENTQAYRDYIYWLHFAEGSLMPPLLMKMVFDKLKQSPMPFFVKPIAKKISDKVMTTFVSPEIKQLLAYIDSYLGEREWFAGEHLSGADFQMSFPLEACVARGTVGQNHPNILAFVQRFQARVAYLAAFDKGGDYDYGPKSA